MAIVALGLNYQVVFHNNSTGPVDLVVDDFGYYAPAGPNGPAGGEGAAYMPLTAPQRILDTRKSTGALAAGVPTPLPVSPDSSVTAAVVNATVVSPTANGFLALYPYLPGNPSRVPTTSNLNYLAGSTVPNLAIVAPGAEPDLSESDYRDLGIYVGGTGTAQVIVDLFGLYQYQ